MIEIFVDLIVMQVVFVQVADIINYVRMVITANTSLEATFGELATSAAACLEKVWRDGKIIESVSFH